MELVIIVAVLILSIALGLAGARGIFEVMFFVMMRVTPLHASIRQERFDIRRPAALGGVNFASREIAPAKG